MIESFIVGNIEVMKEDFYPPYGRNPGGVNKSESEFPKGWRLPNYKELHYLNSISKLGIGNFVQDTSYYTDKSPNGYYVIHFPSGEVQVFESSFDSGRIRLVKDI